MKARKTRENTGYMDVRKSVETSITCDRKGYSTSLNIKKQEKWVCFIVQV